MYFQDEDQRVRQQNYIRYKKLVQQGYSITDEFTNSALYAINDDPYGRPYFLKSTGGTVQRDPFNNPIIVEEWSAKEFVINNKSQLVAKTSADLLIGKGVNIFYTDSTEEQDKILNTMISYNKLNKKLYEAAMRTCSLGDEFIELEPNFENGTIKFIFNLNPCYLNIDCDDYGDVISYTMRWVVSQEESHNAIKDYVVEKIFYKGSKEYRLYEYTKGVRKLNQIPMHKYTKNLEFIDFALTHNYGVYGVDDSEVSNFKLAYTIVQPTGIDDFTIVHWPNYRIFNNYGISDIGFIEALQNTLNNRKTQLNDILDKHCDPPMFGDDSYLDRNGQLSMAKGGSPFFPVSPGGVAPGYIEWQGHITDAQEEIKKLIDDIFENTEISSALIGKEEGGIESGRALMYKLIRSLAMRERKIIYCKEALIDVIVTAQKLYQVWIENDGDLSIDYTFENVLIPEIDFKISLPTDREQTISNLAILKDKGLITSETALKILETLYNEINADIELEKLMQSDQQKFDRDKELLAAQVPDLLKGMPIDEEDQDTYQNE